MSKLQGRQTQPKRSNLFDTPCRDTKLLNAYGMRWEWRGKDLLSTCLFFSRAQSCLYPRDNLPHWDGWAAALTWVRTAENQLLAEINSQQSRFLHIPPLEVFHLSVVFHPSFLNGERNQDPQWPMHSLWVTVHNATRQSSRYTLAGSVQSFTQSMPYIFQSLGQEFPIHFFSFPQWCFSSSELFFSPSYFQELIHQQLNNLFSVPVFFL